MSTCTRTNGTYRCHRRITHKGDCASVALSAGEPYLLRWNREGAYTQRITNVLERSLANETD